MLEELIESELTEFDEQTETQLDEFVLYGYEDDMEGLAEALGCNLEEATEFYEDVRKRVTSAGDVSRVRSRSYRSRRAVATTGLSKAQLRLRARKGAKTRKRNPSSTKQAVRKRKKALKRRKSMGIK